MGWIRDDAPKCKGFIVGFAKDGRKLGYPDDNVSCPVRDIAVNCECGWYSDRKQAAPGTSQTHETRTVNNRRG